jgi:hypothetical protein
LLDTEVDAGGEELSGQNKTKKKKIMQTEGNL